MTCLHLTDDQWAAARAALDKMAADAEAMASNPARDMLLGGDAAYTSLVATAQTEGAPATATVPAYYAAAVTALFVLLAAVPTAAGLHELVSTGAADRAIAGPAGVETLVDGRAAFLVSQGAAQAVVVFVVAWMRAGQGPGAGVWLWAAVACAVAVAAAGLALVLSAVCGSARQAITAANIAVLVASAVGGSMVPRFLMPAWLQSPGWVTPNAWAIEGFAAAARGGDGASAALAAAAVLMASGLGAWAIARQVFRLRVLV